MKKPNYLKFRICNKCNKILHISKLVKNRTSKYGVEKCCKECGSKRRKKIYEEHKEEYYESSKKWKKNNPDKIKEYSKKDYENRREHILEYQKQYKEEHNEQIKEYKKRYREENEHKIFNANNLRRCKEEKLGRGITKEQWLEMMKFFDWKCAYSGESVSEKKCRSIDHIVSLNQGGENEPWNCVPMLRNYNSSKSDKEMLDWYSDQSFFDVERLIKIYEWRIYAYEKWKVGDVA